MGPMRGVTICYVSTGGFSGTWRTWKQAQTLADAGARVVFVGYEDQIPEALAESGHDIRSVHAAGSGQKWYEAKAHQQLAEAIVGTCADIVQSVDLSALDVSWVAAQSLDAHLVYDSHELWAGFVRNPDDPATPEDAVGVLEVERRLIGEAGLVFVTSDQMGLRLSDMYGIPRPLTLLNSPPSRVDRAEEVSEPLRLVFHGGLSKDRNLEGLIRAIGLIDHPVTLDIHGCDRTISADTLRALIDHLGLNQRVRVHGAFRYEEVVGMLSTYDVGVMAARVVEDNFDLTLPNKVFDCMCAGVAIAMYESSAMRALIDAVPFGITIDPSTPDTIARDLEPLVTDPARVAGMKQLAVSAAPRYWWPEQGRMLVDALGALLA